MRPARQRGVCYAIIWPAHESFRAHFGRNCPVSRAIWLTIFPVLADCFTQTSRHFPLRNMRTNGPTFARYPWKLPFSRTDNLMQVSLFRVRVQLHQLAVPNRAPASQSCALEIGCFQHGVAASLYPFSATNYD